MHTFLWQMCTAHSNLIYSCDNISYPVFKLQNRKHYPSCKIDFYEVDSASISYCEMDYFSLLEVLCLSMYNIFVTYSVVWIFIRQSHADVFFSFNLFLMYCSGDKAVFVQNGVVSLMHLCGIFRHGWIWQYFRFHGILLQILQTWSEKVLVQTMPRSHSNSANFSISVSGLDRDSLDVVLFCRIYLI